MSTITLPDGLTGLTYNWIETQIENGTLPLPWKLHQGDVDLFGKPHVGDVFIRLVAANGVYAMSCETVASATEILDFINEEFAPDFSNLPFRG